MSLECNLRYQSGSQNNYHLDVNFSSGHATFYSRISGGFTQIGSTQTFSPTNGHTYTVDYAENRLTSPTTLAVTITDATEMVVLVNNYTATDSTSGLQVAGGYAITAGSPGGTTQTLVVTEVTTYTEDATFTVSPTTAVPGTPETITATGSGTSWTSGTTFSVSGGSGASISGTSVNAGAHTATFTLQPAIAAGTLTISDSTDSATATETELTPTYTVTPTTATTGVNETITATGSDTSWTSGTTFSVSGGTGASVSGISVNTGAQNGDVYAFTGVISWNAHDFRLRGQRYGQHHGVLALGKHQPDEHSSHRKSGVLGQCGWRPHGRLFPSDLASRFLGQILLVDYVQQSDMRSEHE